MNMKNVSVTEANQRFSYLIRQVEEDGIEIHILRRDRPVAVLLPEAKYDKLTKDEREADKARMREILKKGISLGTEPFSREEAYDRS